MQSCKKKCITVLVVALMHHEITTGLANLALSPSKFFNIIVASSFLQRRSDKVMPSDAIEQSSQKQNPGDSVKCKSGHKSRAIKMSNLMSSVRENDSSRVDSRARGARAIDRFLDSTTKRNKSTFSATDDSIVETNEISVASNSVPNKNDHGNVDLVQYPSTADLSSEPNVSRQTTVAVRPAEIVVDKPLHQQTQEKKWIVVIGSVFVILVILVAAVLTSSANNSDSESAVLPQVVESLSPTSVPTLNSLVLLATGKTPSPTTEPTWSQVETSTKVPTVLPSVASTTDVPTEVRQTNVPVAMQTTSPSANVNEENVVNAPTLIPTNDPIEVRTSIPTILPTSTITDAVTTRSPTNVPVPPANPNEEVVDVPTTISTHTPTQVPSSDISVHITGSPTDASSDIPTGAPSRHQTQVPTALPISATSSVPTEQPSTSPTIFPTDVPTAKPTSVPVESPTNDPTTVPTEIPSARPTSQPTSAPTENPTGSPTIVPTEIPGNESTISIPSPVPTKEPTQVPSSAVTSGAPTGIPTAAPTTHPTGTTTSPSMSPSPPLDTFVGDVVLSKFSDSVTSQVIIGNININFESSHSWSLDASQFPNLIEVQGSISIEGTRVESIVFPELVKVSNGGILINHNPDLTSVVFEKLKWISNSSSDRRRFLSDDADSSGQVVEGLRIKSNSNLHTITFPVLTDVAAIDLVSNPMLKQLNLPSLEVVGVPISVNSDESDQYTISHGINIEDTGLGSVSMPSLESVQGPITILENIDLQYVDLIRLTSINSTLSEAGNFYLDNNAALQLCDTPALAYISDDFFIIGENNLKQVNLGSLDNIGGDMLVSSSRHFLSELALGHDYTIGGSIDLPSCNRYVGDVTISDSPGYTFMRRVIIGDVIVEEGFSGACNADDHLPGLKQIEGSLTIVDTSATAVAFPDLESISGGSVSISDNSILTELDFTNLKEISFSKIDELISELDEWISGFGLRKNRHRRLTNAQQGNFEVLNNPMLPIVKLTSLSSANEVAVKGNHLLEAVDMSHLNSTQGNLTVGDNALLTSINFGSVTTVGGYVRIVDNGDSSLADLHCADVDGYVDSLGYDCSFSLGVPDCFDVQHFEEYGHTEQDLIDVRRNCRSSCKLCDEPYSIDDEHGNEADILIYGNVVLESLNASNLQCPGCNIDIHSNYALKSLNILDLRGTMGGRFDGTMTVKHTALEEFKWPHLKYIDGGVVFHSNPFLWEIHMPDVTSISGFLDLNAGPDATNPNLEVMNFKRLQSIDGWVDISFTKLKSFVATELERIEGNVAIFANPQLTAIRLPNVETIGGNIILTQGQEAYSNPKLHTFLFWNLEFIGGSLKVMYSDLEEMKFPNLKYMAGHLVIARNEHLRTLRMPKLESITGDWIMCDNGGVEYDTECNGLCNNLEQGDLQYPEWFDETCPALPPTTPCPTRLNCVDNDDFRDVYGYWCYEWVGYSCIYDPQYDWFSEEDVAEVVENCPVSCGFCDGDGEPPASSECEGKWKSTSFFATDTWCKHNCDAEPRDSFCVYDCVYEDCETEDQDSFCTDNSCIYSFDVDCDDGGPGSDYDECYFGTDCSDRIGYTHYKIYIQCSDCCSSRPDRDECSAPATPTPPTPTPPTPTPPTSDVCQDTNNYQDAHGRRCRRHKDYDCTDYDFYDTGSPRYTADEVNDVQENCALTCGLCTYKLHTSHEYKPPTCDDNTCHRRRNGRCEDGGQGSEADRCDYGTDCDDCCAIMGTARPECGPATTSVPTPPTSSPVAGPTAQPTSSPPTAPPTPSPPTAQPTPQPPTSRPTAPPTECFDEIGESQCAVLMLWLFDYCITNTQGACLRSCGLCTVTTDPGDGNSLMCNDSTCTQSVLDNLAEGYSCGSRIEWVMGEGSSEEDACALVSVEEFPNQCGLCAPDN